MSVKNLLPWHQKKKSKKTPKAKRGGFGEPKSTPRFHKSNNHGFLQVRARLYGSLNVRPHVWERCLAIVSQRGTVPSEETVPLHAAHVDNLRPHHFPCATI